MTSVEVQCCLKDPQKNVPLLLHSDNELLCMQKETGVGCKFDICETNICCYMNNYNSILSHRATTAFRT